MYYNYRYYSPELGRWLSRDPIGENGGLNLYWMVYNNIIDDWDFLGLIEVKDEWGSVEIKWKLKETWCECDPDTSLWHIQGLFLIDISKPDIKDSFKYIDNSGIYWECKRTSTNHNRTKMHEDLHIEHVKAKESEYNSYFPRGEYFNKKTCELYAYLIRSFILVDFIQFAINEGKHKSGGFPKGKNKYQEFLDSRYNPLEYGGNLCVRVL